MTIVMLLHSVVAGVDAYLDQLATKVKNRPMIFATSALNAYHDVAQIRYAQM